jgi:hypothetical protein
MSNGRVSLDFVGEQVPRMQGDLRGVRSELQQLNTRMDHFHARMDHLDAKVDRLEARMDRFETKLDNFAASVDARFEQVERSAATNLQVLLSAINGKRS